MQERIERAVFLTEGNTLIEGWIDMEGDGETVIINEKRYPYLKNACSCLIEDVLVEHPYEFRYPEEQESHLLFSAS